MKTTRAVTYPDAVFHHPVDKDMSLNDDEANIITIRYVFTKKTYRAQFSIFFKYLKIFLKFVGTISLTKKRETGQ